MDNYLYLPTLEGLGFNDGGTRVESLLTGTVDALVPKESSGAATPVDASTATVTTSAQGSASLERDTMFDDLLNFEMPSPDTPFPALDLLGSAAPSAPGAAFIDPFSPLGTAAGVSELSSPATALSLSPLAQPLLSGGTNDLGLLLLPYQNVSPTFKAPVVAQPVMGGFPYPGAFLRSTSGEDNKYKERRKKNNESAKKCRQKKKEEEVKTQHDNGKLAEENAQLRARIQALEEQLDSLKSLIASKLS